MFLRLSLGLGLLLLLGSLSGFIVLAGRSSSSQSIHLATVQINNSVSATTRLTELARTSEPELTATISTAIPIQFTPTREPTSEATANTATETVVPTALATTPITCQV